MPPMMAPMMPPIVPPMVPPMMSPMMQSAMMDPTAMMRSWNVANSPRYSLSEPSGAEQGN